MQRRSYLLLKWAVAGIDRGFLGHRSVERFASLPAATHAWLEEHFADLPRDARPERDDLRAFGNLFATYLEGSFVLLEDPGQRLDSRGHHCHCPMCSWLVAAPRLQPMSLHRADKERARKLQVDSIRARAAARERTVDADALVDDPALRETCALVAYGDDLLRRLDGRSHGPATLALWRRFAWKPEGSPKPGFELTAALILDAEQTLLAQISG